MSNASLQVRQLTTYCPGYGDDKLFCEEGLAVITKQRLPMKVQTPPPGHAHSEGGGTKKGGKEGEHTPCRHRGRRHGLPSPSNPRPPLPVAPLSPPQFPSEVTWNDSPLVGGLPVEVAGWVGSLIGLKSQEWVLVMGEERRLPAHLALRGSVALNVVWGCLHLKDPTEAALRREAEDLRGAMRQLGRQPQPKYTRDGNPPHRGRVSRREGFWTPPCTPPPR